MIFQHMFYENSGGRVLIRDGGSKVYAGVFPIHHFYEDEVVRKLSEEYDVNSHCGCIVGSSLGDAGIESCVARLFGFYAFLGKFVGIPPEELNGLATLADGNDFDFPLNRLNQRGFFRKEDIQGVSVIFPTEDLLNNQKIEERKS